MANIGRSTDIENKDVSEVVYMKRLQYLGFNYSHVTDFSFLSELPHLLLFEIHSPDNEHFAEAMPSLKNSADLYDLVIDANVEDLDFIAENQALKYISVSACSTVIKDISGLRNKPHLKNVSLYNVDCSDMSPLLGLGELERLTVIGTIIPDDIREKLTERKVNVKNISVEDYEKQIEDNQRQREEEQKALREKIEEQKKAYEQQPEVRKLRLQQKLFCAIGVLFGILIFVGTIRLYRKSKKYSG